MSTPIMLSNRYELGATLGYGGMSEVHQGRDIRLGRDVAVKVLRADLARDPQFQERFRREAQNAAALNHPAIVAVYDTGEAQTEYGRLPYIVMEFVDGRTLRDIVKTEGPLSEKRAMEIMADVSAALDFSHRHGIVHRDVKPANVMITQTGAVKVMDFGIARAVHDGQAAVTQTAAVIGTAQYLSPEQARGEQVDARSDVYSAGCVLYELLTGEPPFTGDSPVAVAYQHVREDPNPPSSVYSAVSPALDAIVLKALAKNPLNRYQSAAELRSDLVRVLSGQRPNAPAVMTEDDRTSILTGGRPTQTAAAAGYHDDEYYENEADERRERRNRMLRNAGIAALVIALLVGGAFLAANLFGGGDKNMVAVPDLTDQTQEAARQQLLDLGLNPSIQQVACGPRPNGQPQQCDTNQINKVLRTDPPKNTDVKKSSTVQLFVGKAPEDVKVPNLKGLSQQEANDRLKEAGLVLDQEIKKREADTEQDVGKVIGQDPPPGQQIQAGDSVRIAIGTKPQTVQLSDFSGQSYEQAAANISKLGLTPMRNDVAGTQPEGTVVSQDPSAGKVRKGSTVTLTVSKGNQIQMPDVRNLTPEEAQATLEGAGWNGTLTTTETSTTDPTAIGRVISSSPSAGGALRKDQTVVIKVGQLGVTSGNATPQNATPQNGAG
jgi:eukaryotic-like serine/threonine-protein kinase